MHAARTSGNGVDHDPATQRVQSNLGWCRGDHVWLGQWRHRAQETQNVLSLPISETGNERVRNNPGQRRIEYIAAVPLATINQAFHRILRQSQLVRNIHGCVCWRRHHPHFSSRERGDYNLSPRSLCSWLQSMKGMLRLTTVYNTLCVCVVGGRQRQEGEEV